MTAKEMLKKVQDLKDEALYNENQAKENTMKFFEQKWMQILDILDDALYEYLGGKNN